MPIFELGLLGMAAKSSPSARVGSDGGRVKFTLDKIGARRLPCGSDGLFHGLPQRGHDAIGARRCKCLTFHRLLRRQRPEPINDRGLWQPAPQPPETVAATTAPREHDTV